ncbi:MAG: zinc-ribbon domain-containing protein, partial [Promethearchaeota archaeon]
MKFDTKENQVMGLTYKRLLVFNYLKLEGEIMFCPNCGEKLETPNQRFCASCGREIQTTLPPEVPDV